MRIDKWLWAARFFKTRSLATKACESGKIDANAQTAKASREVRVGDLLQVRNESGEFQIHVLLLSEVRGPATLAQTYYRETEASRLARLKLSEERRLDVHSEGKPSKRDRREIDWIRGRRR